MRLLTGGFAIWIGGWTGQVHHHRDIIGAGGGLVRTPEVLERLRVGAEPYEDGFMVLTPAYALADGLVHRDHALVPPDEIDPDYLDQREDLNLFSALKVLGVADLEAAGLVAPYLSRLTPEVDDPQIL